MTGVSVGQAVLAALGNASRDWVWALDDHGVLRYSNDRATQLLGVEGADLVGTRLVDLVAPHDRPLLDKLLAQPVAIRHVRFAGVGREVPLSVTVHRLSEATDGLALVGCATKAPDTPFGMCAEVQHFVAGHGMRVVFEPIVDLRDEQVLGVEALSRFTSSRPTTVTEWFAAAHGCGLGTALELTAVELALARARDLVPDSYLALNVSARALLDPRTTVLIAGASLPPNRLVIELTEHEPISDYRQLLLALEPLRASGTRLAVDDTGAGYASFRHVLSLRPDIIKLDAAITHDLDTDPGRRAFAAAVVTFAGDVAATVVAEGIETAAELAALQQLGVTAGQGFLFGEAPQPPRTAPPAERAAHLQPDRPATHLH